MLAELAQGQQGQSRTTRVGRMAAKEPGANGEANGSGGCSGGGDGSSDVGHGGGGSSGEGSGGGNGADGDGGDGDGEEPKPASSMVGEAAVRSEEQQAVSTAAAARAVYAARKAAEEGEAAALGLGVCDEDEDEGKAASKQAGGKRKAGTKRSGRRRSTDAERPGRPDLEDFFAIMFLARCKHEMGDEVDALLDRADVAWKSHDLATTDKLFGYQKEKLVHVSTDDWLMLLMRIMIMEYNLILFEKRYRLQWGLKEALMALREVELTPPPRPGEHFSNDFHHSFYLATHIVYAQSAYNAIKADERQIPWLYRYVRQSFRYWMRCVKEQKTDPSTYVDIDGIGECCDCLRGCGMTEASDPMLCEGTLYMLRTQRKNGFWPAVMFGEDSPESNLDFYHKVHPTWVCTQALRDRDFKVGGATMFWPEFVAKVIKESNFQTLAYKPGW